MQTEKEYLTGREISALRCESVGEYSLPDYNGDVKKILAVKTKVFPGGKFVGEDALEFSGTVGYEVVYLDGENNITHAEFSTDYEAAVKINSETYADCDVVSSVSSSSVRLIGPRKLSVKCSLDNEVRIAEKRVYDVEGDAFMEYEPEVLTSSVNVMTPAFASGQSREIEEEILHLDGAITDEVEVLLSDARFELDALDVSADSVTVKGSVLVSLLLKNADEMPRLVAVSLPLSEEVSFAEIESFDSLDARCEITELKTAVSPAEDGVSLTASVTVTPRVYGKKNTPLELICDAFVKERGVENEYSDFSYTEHVSTETKTENFEFKCTMAEVGVESAGDVIYAEAQARLEQCTLEDNGVKIDGEIRFGGIVCRVDENEETIFYPIRFSLPYSQKVNMSCQLHDNMRAYCALNSENVKINFDENNVYAFATLTSFVTVTSDKRQRCLGTSYLTDEEFLDDDSVVTVYYPDASESLFSIAKRFHTSVGEIAESNRLSENVFASFGAPVGNFEVKKLIIK